jgi:hypothetical protein
MSRIRYLSATKRYPPGQTPFIQKMEGCRLRVLRYGEDHA